MIDAASISLARLVRIVDEIDRRGIKLRRQGHELVGPCPVCGDGGTGHRSDRFAVHTVKNIWLCRQCPAGGGVIDLVQHLDGVDFRDAVEVLTGDGPATPQRTTAVQPASSANADDNRRRAMHLWNEAVPITGILAERYLVETRRLALPPDVSPRVLRFHPGCPFGPGARHPCLVALYRDIAADEPRAIMRTALTPDARKIDRKALGPVGGAAVKLSAAVDVITRLTIGEGLETTLEGTMPGFDLAPAWALGSAGAIAKFPLLGIETLTVLAEADDDGANERATTQCAGRWIAAGRKVYRASPTIGGDMNDAVMAGASVVTSLIVEGSSASQQESTRMPITMRFR